MHKTNSSDKKWVCYYAKLRRIPAKELYSNAPEKPSESFSLKTDTGVSPELCLGSLPISFLISYVCLNRFASISPGNSYVFRSFLLRRRNFLWLIHMRIISHMKGHPFRFGGTHYRMAASKPTSHTSNLTNWSYQ